MGKLYPRHTQNKTCQLKFLKSSRKHLNYYKEKFHNSIKQRELRSQDGGFFVTIIAKTPLELCYEISNFFLYSSCATLTTVHPFNGNCQLKLELKDETGFNWSYNIIYYKRGLRITLR